jgi:hypothetical protein
MDPHQDFLGTGWAFPPAFLSGAAAPVMVSGTDDIRESLGILLTTTVGERLLHPTYGCDLRRHLFEPLNTTLVTLLRDLVHTALLRHEPRIRPDTVTVTEEPPAGGTLLIRVDYVVRATNARQNVVFPFYRDAAAA